MQVMLYVPGNDQGKLAKTLTLDAPAFILDLEDSVRAEDKASARARVGAFLETCAPAERVYYVRVNPASTPALAQDLEAVVTPALAGVVLPKAEARADVEAVARRLDELEGRRGLRAGAVRILALIETARGLEALQEIGRASPRVLGFAFGAADFCRDLGLPWPVSAEEKPSETLVAAKARLVTASRALGLAPPHDGAYPRLHDPNGLRREALQARRMGFGGKHAIHPDQVALLREVFAPTEAEVQWAERVVAAWEAATARGAGVASVDGEFVDAPVVARAQAILASRR